MRTLDASLRLYRKTLKRIRPAHVALHRLASGLILPGLERASDFKTIADDPFWFRLELLTRRLESDTRRVLERLTAPGMVALDIGAHIGYHTRLLARLVGNTGRVIALEPHPGIFQTLRHNTRDLSNTTALQLAVADKPGSAELHDYLMMSASSSLHYDETLARQQQAQMGADDVAPRVLAGFEPQTYRVRAIAIDDCLAEWGIDRVDIIKMDIEGAELTALRGMRRAIRRSPDLALVMEYNPSALQAFGHAPTAVLDAARGLGGRAALIERETARLLAGMGVVNLLLRR
ncbi:MAG: FkbM family methyltransferase [Chloroflexi bacterium]|nr:FkbM family methyltransferase [Chloroflexota bacterium]